MPTPPEQLRDSLAESRARGCASFEVAWKHAWQRVRWLAIDGTEERNDWKTAMEATREEWEAAFLDRPTRNRNALALLAFRVEPDQEHLRDVKPVRAMRTPDGHTNRRRAAVR